MFQGFPAFLFASTVKDGSIALLDLDGKSSHLLDQFYTIIQCVNNFGISLRSEIQVLLTNNLPMYASISYPHHLN